MDKTKIKTLIKQVRGVSYKPDDLHNELNNNSVILLRANNIDDGKINFDDVVYVDKSKVSNEQYLRKGDILICASSGSKSLVGKAASIDFDRECTFGAFCKVVRPNDEVVDYLGVYFQSPMYRRKISEVAIGANINNIRNEHIEELEVPLFSRVDQQEVVKKIKLVLDIIIKRKEEISSLDNLIKARFVEMFGDAIYNNKEWQTDTVEKLCKEIYGGGTPSKSHPEYYEGGDIPWVSSKDMKTDVLTDSQIHINQLGVDNSTARMVPVNSVIVVMRSGILKHTLPVAINAVPITVNQDLKVFIPSERILTRFLAVQLKMHEKDILSGVRAVTADNIEFNSLKQRKLIVPSIELQQEYVKFLEQVDKSKVAVQKALNETQVLFDSLMQQYFG